MLYFIFWLALRFSTGKSKPVPRTTFVCACWPTKWVSLRACVYSVVRNCWTAVAIGTYWQQRPGEQTHLEWSARVGSRTGSSRNSGSRSGRSADRKYPCRCSLQYLANDSSADFYTPDTLTDPLYFRCTATGLCCSANLVCELLVLARRRT